MLQPSVAMETEDNSNKMWQQLAEVITPSIVKVVDFAKNVPGFEMVCESSNNHLLLLQNWRNLFFKIDAPSLDRHLEMWQI